MSETQHWFDDVDFIPEQDVMLERGDSGKPVESIQRQLKEAGYDITIDGVFGPGTERTIKQFQKDVGLVQDGRVGPKTQWRLDNHPKDPKVLSQEDLQDAAAMLDVSVASVMAVNAVESRGSGFFTEDKPTILYERHIMFRRLKHHGIDPRPYVDQYPNIVNTRTGGYRGGVAEHQRLNAACQLHEESGLESASWGLFQIMGFHWEHLGYQSVNQFVGLMKESERHHLLAFVKFIRAYQRLHEALKERNWARFARIYNGPAYAKHNPPYDTRLARAFDKYSQSVA